MNSWTLAALGALGIVLYATHSSSPKKSDSIPGPLLQPSDSEIAAVADYALLHETSAVVLRDLSAKMRVLPMGTASDPTAWNRRRAALDTRAAFIEAGLNPQLTVASTSGTMTLAQALKKAGH